MNDLEKAGLTKSFSETLKWSKQTLVLTKKGYRFRRVARGNKAAERIWRTQYGELYALGFTRKQMTSSVVYSWWSIPDEKLLREREENATLSRAKESDFEVPSKLGRSFRGYQKAGISYIMRAFKKPTCSALLGDEMGLGKTPQAIGVINADEKISRVLIIPPAKLRDNWAQELHNWLSRPLSVGIADSKCFPSADIVICNFEIIHNCPRVCSYYWDLIIIDEAHRLKNPETKRARHIFGWRPTGDEKKTEYATAAIPTRRKLALSGSPIPNRIMEIQPILGWLDKDTYGDAYKFGMTYGEEDVGTAKLEELQTELRSTLMCRRLKAEVLSELPPKTRQIIELEGDTPGDFQRRWDKVFAECANKKEVQGGDAFTNEVNQLDDNVEIAFNEMSRFRHECALIKVHPFVEDIRDRMEEISKIIIFGHHTDCLRQLLVAFAEFRPAMIIGETKQPMAEVEKFQKDPKCRMILGSDSMMEGLNLTAASVVAFFEGDWVPGKLAQKEDRAHRYGQTDNVLCLYYVLKNTLDARMIRRCLEKRAIIDAALDQPAKATAEG